MSASELEPHARRRVEDVLIDCLLCAAYPSWPGGDGLTVEDVLAAYRDGLRAGVVPTPTALARRHPEFADDVLDYFADLG